LRSRPGLEDQLSLPTPEGLHRDGASASPGLGVIGLAEGNYPQTEGENSILLQRMNGNGTFFAVDD